MTGDIRVVVVDDHPMVVDGLTLALDVPGITVVGTARDVAGALEAATAEPDVIVLDLNLPDGSGVRAAEEIRRRHPGVAVLILTMVADEHSVSAAMNAGVGGYLVKGASRDEIVRAVRAVADGQVILGSEIARAAIRSTRPEERFPTLTDRERAVLALLAEGLDNPAIGERLGVSGKTVANHVSAILTKLQVADRTQAALLVRDPTRL